MLSNLFTLLTMMDVENPSTSGFCEDAKKLIAEMKRELAQKDEQLAKKDELIKEKDGVKEFTFLLILISCYSLLFL